MSPPGLVITLLLSVLLQTNPALMDLVNILSKLPPVTIEPFKQEGKNIYITFYIEINVKIFLVILIYCVYLQEVFIVLTNVLGLDLANSLSGCDHYIILAHRFLTASSETVRLHHHRLCIFFGGVFLEVCGLNPIFDLELLLKDAQSGFYLQIVHISLLLFLLTM